MRIVRHGGHRRRPWRAPARRSAGLAGGLREARPAYLPVGGCVSMLVTLSLLLAVHAVTAARFADGWLPVDAPSEPVGALAVDASRHRLYAAAQSGVLLRSDDGGQSWW